MDVRYLRTCFEHNAWANERVFDAAQALSDEEYRAPAGLSFESVHATLLHVVDTEIVWLNRWRGALAQPRLTGDSVPSLAELRKRCQENDRRLNDYLSTLSDDSLRRELRFTTANSREEGRPLWQLMAHVLHHSAQFRSEAAVALSRLGQSPGSLDLLFYLRGHPE
jgi:uncharacterized damage-inducible protein DinB